MGFERFGAIVFASGVVWVGACSHSSSGPPQDASGSDVASDTGESLVRPPDASVSDSPGSSDSSPADMASAEASAVPDGVATDAEAGCGPVGPPERSLWDGALPPSCSSPDDTDHDGVPDCADGCPYDPHKIAPGECGCNVPDIDTDGDGFADCIDHCPEDPNNTNNGQCGCVGGRNGGRPALPAGTPCTDPACPQSGATCDGAGVCGDRAMCSPCPGGRYFVTYFNNVGFWFCGATLPPVTGPGCVLEDGGGGPGATWMAAQSACAAKGMTLARIQTTDDDDELRVLLTANLWLGGNDLQTSGEWYWSSATSNSDTLFWTGAPDGSRQNNLYVNWASGAPASASCAVLRPDGYWADADCSQTLGYLCQ